MSICATCARSAQRLRNGLCVPCQGWRRIDWFAVDVACQGTPMKLGPWERKAVVRRLEWRMMQIEDGPFVPPGKLSAKAVGAMLGIDTRSAQRIRDELPPATERRCPSCRERAWVITASGVIEPHPDRWYEQCERSGQVLVRGLAAVRPDLYTWAVPA